MTALLALCAGWWRHWRWSTSAIRSTVPQRSATCSHSCMICSVPPAIWRCVGIIVMVIFITITFIFTVCHYRYSIEMYICFMVLTVKWLELWTWISVNFILFYQTWYFGIWCLIGALQYIVLLILSSSSSPNCFLSWSSFLSHVVSAWWSGIGGLAGHGTTVWMTAFNLCKWWHHFWIPLFITMVTEEWS